MGVDLNDMSLMDEVIEVDGTVTSEEFFNPPLPDDGEHQVVLKLGNRGIKIERQFNKETKRRDGQGFLNVHLQLASVKENGSVGGTIGFDNCSSLVMPSVGTSRVHMAFDGSVGPDGSPMTLPARATLGELKTAIETAISQGPRSFVTTQWLAQVNRGTKDSPDYQDVLKGQKNFPKRLDADGNETGRYEAEVADPKSQTVCRAQVKVLKYSRAQK